MDYDASAEERGGCLLSKGVYPGAGMTQSCAGNLAEQRKLCLVQ